MHKNQNLSENAKYLAGTLKSLTNDKHVNEYK